jgi:hypothetical protein
LAMELSQGIAWRKRAEREMYTYIDLSCQCL